MAGIISAGEYRFRKQFYEGGSKVVLKALQAMIHDGKLAGKVELAYEHPVSGERHVLIILMRDRIVGQKPEEDKRVDEPRVDKEKLPSLKEIAENFGCSEDEAIEKIQTEYNRLCLVKSEYEEILGRIRPAEDAKPGEEN